MPKTKVRPGIEMRRTLRQPPQRASIRGMFVGYQLAIDASKLEDPNNPTKSNGMCYESYRKLVWMAREAGLVEIVGFGDEIPGLSMMQKDDAGDLVVVPSTPVLHALTTDGASLDLPWENIPKFYQAHVAQERGEEAFTDLPPVPTITLPDNFSTNSRPRILVHLTMLKNLIENVEDVKDLDDLENDWPEMDAEVVRLAEVANEWAEAARDRADARENDDELQDRAENIETFANELDQQDLSAAIDALETI